MYRFGVFIKVDYFRSMLRITQQVVDRAYSTHVYACDPMSAFLEDSRCRITALLRMGYLVLAVLSIGRGVPYQISLWL